MRAPYYQTYLKEELSRRVKRNSKYSLRAFSRALKVDVALLSKAMSGKGPLTLASAKKLLESLEIDPSERLMFLNSVADENKRRKISPVEVSKTHDVDVDWFRVIGDWYHYAILELTFTECFRSDPKWIARQLGISQREVQQAIYRLTKLGLMEKTGKRLRKTSAAITTTHSPHITTPALKKLQRQVLEKAIESLENDPINERSMTSVTLAIDPDKIEIAKRLIHEFMNAFWPVMESGKRKRVFQLGISFYPIQLKKNVVKTLPTS